MRYAIIALALIFVSAFGGDDSNVSTNQVVTPKRVRPASAPAPGQESEVERLTRLSDIIIKGEVIKTEETKMMSIGQGSSGICYVRPHLLVKGDPVMTRVTFWDNLSVVSREKGVPAVCVGWSLETIDSKCPCAIFQTGTWFLKLSPGSTNIYSIIGTQDILDQRKVLEASVHSSAGEDDLVIQMKRNRELKLTGAGRSEDASQHLIATFVELRGGTNTISVSFASGRVTPNRKTIERIILGAVDWSQPSTPYGWHQAKAEVVLSAPTNSVDGDFYGWFLVSLKIGKTE